ncbi:MAG: AMP-binding protein [Pseudomonadota bacterium]
MPDITFAGRTQAFAELADEAARGAAGLAALGATNAIVALLLRNDAAFVTVSEAARLAGAATLPLNWHLKAPDVAFILQDSGAAVLVAHVDLWNTVAQGLPETLKRRLKVLLVPTPEVVAMAYRVEPEGAMPPQDAQHWSELVAAHAPIAAPVETRPHPLIYTSGTTGRPKGVQRLGTARPAPVAYDAFFDETARTLLATPLYHAAAHRFLDGTLRAGGSVVLPVRFDAEGMLREIETHRITMTFVVPAMFQRFLRLPDEVRRRYDLSSLRHVVVAGAPCAPELKAAMIAWWGPVIYEYYGSTELGAVTFASSADALARPGTVGRVVATARLAILDEAGNPCPQGEIGEVYGRRDDLPDFTYLNCDAARAEAGQGDLVTMGDVGFLDAEGYLFLSDRKTDMIISNGVNIYPAQIEAAILSYPDVADCAVFGIPDEAAGESVAAIVEPMAGQSVDTEALTAFLTDKLAGYMVPRRIEERRNFPRDAAGKVRKRELRAPFWETAKRAI